jgi:hypothetical protein
VGVEHRSVADDGEALLGDAELGRKGRLHRLGGWGGPGQQPYRLDAGAQEGGLAVGDGSASLRDGFHQRRGGVVQDQVESVSALGDQLTRNR